MTDSRLRALLEDYAKPLQFKPANARRRHWPKLAVRIGAAGVAAGMIAYGMMQPSTPEVAMKRLTSELADVKTMTVRTSTFEGDPSRELVLVERWFDRGRWRIHARVRDAFEEIGIIRDDRVYSYLPKKRRATVEPLPALTQFGYEGGSAVRFFLNELNQGDSDIAGKARLETMPNGVQRLTIAREGGQNRCVIDIDPLTGLPMEATTTATYAGDSNRQTTRYRFRFNEQISPEKFDPQSFGMPVLDLVEAQRKYRALWNTPLATAEGIAFRDAAVTADGTVFVTYSAPKTDRIPDTLRDGKGTVYLRVMDMQPGGGRADTNSAKTSAFGDANVYTTVWIPAAPLRKPATQIRVAISKRSLGSLPNPGKKPAALAELPLKLRPLSGGFPEFGTAFVLGSYEDRFAFQTARTRVKHFQRVGDVEGEIRWRRQEAREATTIYGDLGRSLATTLAKRLRELKREAEAKAIERGFLSGARLRL